MFRQVQIRDSISPDMDFGDDTARLGWIRRYALRWPSADRATRHTVGGHQPHYTPLYTFSKFRLEGIRARYRRREGRARLMLERLCHSVHPAAPLALIATAHGFFHRDQSDQLAPYERTAEFDVLQEFLATPNAAADATAPTDAGDPYRRFCDAYAFAVTCRQRRATAPFLAHLDRLKRAAEPAAWLPLAGLCHGVFQEDHSEARANEAYAALVEIL